MVNYYSFLGNIFLFKKSADGGGMQDANVSFFALLLSEVGYNY